MSENALFMVSKSIGLLAKIKCDKRNIVRKGELLGRWVKTLKYGLCYGCMHWSNVNEIRFLKDKMKEILEITAKCEICFSYKLKFEYQFKVLCCN